MKDLAQRPGYPAAVFLPLGERGHAAIPKAEDPGKLVAWSPRALATAAWASPFWQLRLRPPGSPVRPVDKLLDPAHRLQRYHRRPRRACRCPLLALTMLVVPLGHLLVEPLPEPHNPKAFLFLILILETGMVGTFVAEDLLLFFVFFEVVLLPMYFMIGVWGGPDRQCASIKFFLYTLFGSALMLVSFLAPLYFLTRHLRHAPSCRRASSAGHRPHHRPADLRRHVRGLRHQGADVPVPRGCLTPTPRAPTQAR